MSATVTRHSKAVIFIHWFNAVCWIFLLLTGFGLLANKTMQPIAQWYVNALNFIFGSGGNMLICHVVVAVSWSVVMAAMALIRWRKDTLPFLKEIVDIHPMEDLVWVWRKGLWLVLGPKLAKKFGWNTELPKSGFYNAGQQYVAIIAVLASFCLVFSGAVLIFTSQPWAGQTTAQWLILLHFCCAGLMAILLPVHIYMAALAPGEAPALKSMFFGSVPVEHIKHHNPKWYDQLKEQGIV